MVANANSYAGAYNSGMQFNAYQPTQYDPWQAAMGPGYGTGATGGVDMMVVPPGAIGGTPNNPIYGPGGPGTDAQGNPLPSFSGFDATDWGAPALPAGTNTMPGMPFNPQSQFQQLPDLASYGSNPYGGGGGGYGRGPTGGTSYGGISTVNPQAGPADYENLQQFADAAHEQAMRYINPQMEQQNRNLDQQLINQGIDPRSEYGQFMADQLGRQQSDLLSKTAFDSIGFGQQIQDQYFQQDFARSNLANQMARADWQTQLGYDNNATNRYLGDQRYNLGLGELDLGRRQFAQDQMKFYEDLAYRQYMADESNRRFDMQFMLPFIGNPYGNGGGQAAPGGFQGYNPNSAITDWINNMGLGVGGGI